MEQFKTSQSTYYNNNIVNDEIFEIDIYVLAIWTIVKWLFLRNRFTDCLIHIIFGTVSQLDTKFNIKSLISILENYNFWGDRRRTRNASLIIGFNIRTKSKKHNNIQLYSLITYTSYTIQNIIQNSETYCIYLLILYIEY